MIDIIKHHEPYASTQDTLLISNYLDLYCAVRATKRKHAFGLCYWQFCIFSSCHQNHWYILVECFSCSLETWDIQELSIAVSPVLGHWTVWMCKLSDGETTSRGIGFPFATFRYQHLHAMQIFHAQLLNLWLGLQKRDCIGMPLLNRKRLRKSTTCTPRNTWSGSTQRIPRTAPWYQLSSFCEKTPFHSLLTHREVAQEVRQICEWYIWLFEILSFKEFHFESVRRWSPTCCAFTGGRPISLKRRWHVCDLAWA